MQSTAVTMEDSKSYTVRTETGEIHLMSQEEVATLVRATMARARGNSRNPHRLSRDTNASSTSGDLNRRFSLASRYSSGKVPIVSDLNQSEEISTTTTKMPSISSTVDASTASSPIQLERRQSRRLTTRRDTKERTRPLGNADERFASLVRTVGPYAMDRDFDPETVSFTVSTEVDGQKHLSEQELNDLVRNSVVRARKKAQLKGSMRRSAEYRKSRLTTMILSDDSLSPRKSLNRKFSWSTVEKSDEECEDDRDDETAERGEGNMRCEESPLIPQPGDVEIVPNLAENRQKEESVANDQCQTSELEEVLKTPCTSPRKTNALSPRPTPLDHRSMRGYETPSLSLVLSTGGDSVLSDRVIYRMVKQSMDKAKQTRQEITQLLEDTPSGVSKVDVADIVEGTMRRARETAQSLELPSLSPPKQRPVSEDTQPTTTPVANLPEEECVPAVPRNDSVEEKSISNYETLKVTEVIQTNLASDVSMKEEVVPDVLPTTVAQSATFGQSEIEHNVLTDDNQSPLDVRESTAAVEEQTVVTPEGAVPLNTEHPISPVVDTAVTVRRASCFDTFCCGALALNPTATQEEKFDVTEAQPQSPDVILENPAIPRNDEILVESNDVSTSLSTLARDTVEDLEATSAIREIASSNADGLEEMLKDEQIYPNQEFQTITNCPKDDEVVIVVSVEDDKLATEEAECFHDKRTADEATNESIEVSRTNTLEEFTERIDDTPAVLSEDAQDSLKPGSDPSMSLLPAKDEGSEICEEEECIDTSKARRKLRRQQNRSKYRRHRQGEIESVITDEFLAEVNSMRGLKITASELAKIFQHGKASVSPEENHHRTGSRVHYASADESLASNQQSDYESLTQVDANKSSVQSPAFCADFLSIFSDPFDADDDFGSVSLYNNESIAETLSKKESHRDKASRSLTCNPTPKSAEYESEMANSYNGRRLTFSFSEGRYTVSMSLSDEY